MELLPVLTITSLGVVGLCLMVAAFVTAARSPRFPDAPPGTRPPGALSRWLMMAGATLGSAFGLLLLVPGVLPWVNSSSGYADLWLGAASGAVIGALIVHSTRIASRRLSGATGEKK